MTARPLKLSEDEKVWLGVCSAGEPMTAGEVARRSGNGKGGGAAFAHFARKHGDWIERRLVRINSGHQFLYKLTSEGAAQWLSL